MNIAPDISKYLIIGGSTKCGTTSVFKYFEYHPEVCPASMKETRYFWTNAYPLPHRLHKNQEAFRFSNFFDNCNHPGIRVEATPDYLYSTDAAKKIRGELPEVKMVFILRDP